MLCASSNTDNRSNNLKCRVVAIPSKRRKTSHSPCRECEYPMEQLQQSMECNEFNGMGGGCCFGGCQSLEGEYCPDCVADGYQQICDGVGCEFIDQCDECLNPSESEVKAPVVA